MFCKPIYWSVLFTLCILTPFLRSQTDREGITLVRDANRPFVYLRFDHIAQGKQRNEYEPALRVWLHFVNNSNVPIKLRAYGLADGLVPGEVGVMDDVVMDLPMLTITSGNPEPEVLNQPISETPDAQANTESGTLSAGRMPSGYTSEVAGVTRVAPGESVMFSVPVDHLGSRSNGWHMEIPFWFSVPEGRGPRDPIIGGEPIMRLHYHYYDLPDEAKAKLR